MQATPARQQVALVSVGAVSFWKVGLVVKMSACAGLLLQSASSVTSTTDSSASSRMKPLSARAFEIARRMASSGDSKPQPLMPCGPKQAKASAIVTPAGRFCWPAIDSSQGWTSPSCEAVTRS